MGKGKKYFKNFIALLGCFLISSCYSPDKFTGEVVIDKSGRYVITYVGDLIWAPLMREINLGLVDAEKIPQKVENVKRDLEREPSFQQIVSKGDGRFGVKYKRVGRIEGSGNINFVRGNSNPIMAVRTETNEITTFSGAYLSAKRAQQARDGGIPINGVFRVITDAPVLSHNAPVVLDNDKGPGQIYEWKITDFGQVAPKLTLQIDFVDFITPEINY